MYLPDGKKVDSQDGWAFRIGVKGLGRGSQTVNDVKTIAGFENIVASLTPGARVAVKIPPESAYGATGSTYPPVPAASPVVAYIELVSLGNIKGDNDFTIDHCLPIPSLGACIMTLDMSAEPYDERAAIKVRLLRAPRQCLFLHVFNMH